METPRFAAVVFGQGLPDWTPAWSANASLAIPFEYPVEKGAIAGMGALLSAAPRQQSSCAHLGSEDMLQASQEGWAVPIP